MHGKAWNLQKKDLKNGFSLNYKGWYSKLVRKAHPLNPLGLFYYSSQNGEKKLSQITDYHMIIKHILFNKSCLWCHLL